MQRNSSHRGFYSHKSAETAPLCQSLSPEFTGSRNMEVTGNQQMVPTRTMENSDPDGGTESPTGGLIRAILDRLWPSARSPYRLRHFTDQLLGTHVVDLARSQNGNFFNGNDRLRQHEVGNAFRFEMCVQVVTRGF